jgi:hypothetical protein
MPWDPAAFPLASPDITELAAVFLTLLFTLGVMVALGRWWSR